MTQANDLLPCPFHKKPIYPNIYTGFDKGNGNPGSGGSWATIECPHCNAGFHINECCSEDDALEYVVSEWNTRYERTCAPHVVARTFTGDVNPSFWQAVCDCGWIVGEDGTPNLIEFEHIDNYCGGCGAKVVVE